MNQVKRYRAAVVGAGRMGGTIDDEVEGHPSTVLPYSHGAAYAGMPDIELVAFADVIEDKARGLASRYGVSGAYGDYREMIEREKPEILSVCTRPGSHAEIVEFACSQGVRAIYCEKPLCNSMEEADRMVAACEGRGIPFNLGANRRFLPSYQRLKDVIASEAIGKLEAMTLNCAGAALWTHTHTSDLLLMLNGDREVEFVQGCCDFDAAQMTGGRLDRDPGVHMGYVKFLNGVHGFIVPGSGWDIDVHGSRGKIRTLNDMAECLMWIVEGPWKMLRPAPFPDFSEESAPVRIIRDLIRALETGRETLNPVRLARRSQEVMMGIVESHRQGGGRVTLPLQDRSLYIAEP